MPNPLVTISWLCSNCPTCLAESTQIFIDHIRFHINFHGARQHHQLLPHITTTIMGIQSQNALLFKSNEMEFNDIVYLIEQRHAERRRSTTPNPITARVRPKVTIDASLIGYKFLGNSLHPSDGVLIICRALANRNIDVLIICDPPTRHHSKRAHHQRVGKKEKDKLKLMLCRMELSRAGDDSDKIRRVTNEIRKLEKGESRAFLPLNFVARLQELASKFDAHGKGEIMVEIAPFQADPSIADVALRGGCEAIFSGDSDFAMYVGPGGPDKLSDIMVRDIKINAKQSTITGCTLITGQRDVASKIEEILSNRGVAAVFPVEPKFPLFNGVEDPTTRALIALALGCDALPGGVAGVGTSSLHNLLGTCNWDDLAGVHVELAKKLACQKKSLVKDPAALLCLANSLIYEKTNSAIGYMYAIPKVLEAYNEAFVAEGTEVIDGPAMIVCKGCDGNKHPFLEAEGMLSCATCKASLCRFCTWEEANEDSNVVVLCMDCKRYNIAGVEESKTEREMREFLKQHSVNVPVAATYTEVLSLYRRYDDDDHGIFADDIRSVRYPLLPSSTLNILHESSKNIERLNILHETSHGIERIETLSVRHIGSFIRSGDIEAMVVAGLLRVLASLTDITPRKKGESLSPTHTISKNLINMATNARVHTSQRLIERSLRHATDRASPDIFDGQITLGICNTDDCKGDVCVIISNKVRASMKNVEYKTKAAITHNHFLATECTCRAGCSNEPSPSVDPADIGNGKIICSHGMTLPVSLGLALFRGMAAHILSELRLRLLRDDFEDSFDGPTLSAFRGDISRLMKAAGRTETAMDCTKSILQCLDMFSVGTDLPKKPPSPPKSHDLGLLRDKCRYESVAKKAEQMMKEEELSLDETVPINLSTMMSPTLAEEYLNGQLAVDALSVVFGKSEFQVLTDGNDDVGETLPIGFELNRDRSSHHLTKMEYNERSIATMEVARKLEIALLQWTNVRGRFHRLFDTTPPPNTRTTSSKKRKAEEITAVTVRCHKLCCVDGCNENSELIRVGDYPNELPHNASRKRQITHAIKKFMRRERTELLGFGRDCDYKDLRACKEHWKFVEGKHTTCNIHLDDGSTERVSIAIPTFQAPVRVGNKSFKSPPVNYSKGNGIDRATLRHVLEVSQNEHALAQQQIIEMQDVKDGEQDLEQINPLILASTGLDVHKASRDIDAEMKCIDDINVDSSWRAPKITLKCLVPKEVKRRTGFHDLKLLLGFVSVVCGGDMTVMTSTTSILTWLEEWVLYFEFVWGRTSIRFPDYASTYQCREKTLRKVIGQKLKQILAARSRWPMADVCIVC